MDTEARYDHHREITEAFTAKTFYGAAIAIEDQAAAMNNKRLSHSIEHLQQQIMHIAKAWPILDC